MARRRHDLRAATPRRIMGPLVVAGLVACGLAVPPARAAVEYTILDLGDFGPPAASTQGTFGISGSRAMAVSPRGFVTGVSSDHQARLRPFRMLPPSSLLDLRTVPDGEFVFGFPWDVNDQNAVAGGSLIAGGMHATLWDSTGMAFDLGTLNGARSEALALNDDGWIVGFSGTDSLDVSEELDRAFLWRPGFGMSNLGALSGGLGSCARDIDASGRIVGEADDAGGVTQAVMWAGGSASLLDPMALDGSIAYGMNDRGTVVGTAVDAEGAARAFRWTQPSGLQLLPSLADSGSSLADAVSDCDVAVGFSAAPIDSPGFGRQHAVRWAPSGAIEDLNQLADPDAGWLLMAATDIGPTGRITGHGIAPDGGHRGFLLIPVMETSCDAPTPTLLTAFRASVRPGAVDLEFAVEDEVSWSAVDVYRRRATSAGLEELLTPAPLRLDGGGLYHFTDRSVAPGERYFYTLGLLAPGGAEMRAGSLEVLVPTFELVLAPTGPNPTPGGLKIEFALPRTGWAALRIMDARGGHVCTVFEGDLTGGAHTLAWDGRLDSGRPAPSAVYFLVLESEGLRRVRRFAVMH